MTERQENAHWHGYYDLRLDLYDPDDWPRMGSLKVPDAERPVDVDDEEERDR